MIKILYLPVFFFSLCLNNYSQNLVTFDEEDITFRIKDSIFTIQGIYYFNSPEPANMPLLFPFPKDSIYSDPFEIEVKDINRDSILDLNESKDHRSILFTVEINGRTPVMIKYNQALKTNKAEYILVTTNYWNAPLKKAVYKLVVEPDLEIKYFSITPDREISIENEKIYFWQKYDFSPDRNFVIIFQRQPI